MANAKKRRASDRRPVPAAEMHDLLTARSTLYRAFERVRENGGCRGCDGITLGRFAADLEWQLDAIQASLLARRYHPLPLLRFPVPKPRGGLRHLSVPTVSAYCVLVQRQF